ncbi:MAG: hypothetical protein H6922_05780 [Pseudomonadaceae bacterium]|nr:hypothetical protein [Pseudomonadaceae bacterium]
MAVYMVFLRNMNNGEDFALPVDAESNEEAYMMAEQRHPQPLFAPLTCFSLRELSKMVDDARRWPGVASKVQPTMEQMLQRVNVRIGKLPPMPGQAPVTEAKLTESRGFARGVMEREAKVATVQHIAPVQADAPRKVAAKKPAPAPQPAAPVFNKNQGRSVVDVLRALKG